MTTPADTKHYMQVNSTDFMQIRRIVRENRLPVHVDEPRPWNILELDLGGCILRPQLSATPNWWFIQHALDQAGFASRIMCHHPNLVQLIDAALRDIEERANELGHSGQ